MVEGMGHEPAEIFRRLLIGSEGTLGFIAEAVFETVVKPSRTTVSWLHFDGIESATEPVPALVEAGATAVELMVAPALMVAAQNIAGAPQDWLELPPTSAALLVEFGAETDGELDKLVAGAEEILKERELIKLASLSVALAGALRERGIADADLIAEVGIAVFKTAFERWIGQEDRVFAELVRDAVGELKLLALSGSS